jgi:hypothetical protein
MLGLAVLCVLAVSPATAFECNRAAIPHSNRTGSSKCSGSAGDECAFACDPGYLGFGRHVCQDYTTKKGDHFIRQSFFGGRCDRLCAPVPAACAAGLTPVRTNTTDRSGPCLSTTCLPPDEALKRLGRGAYELWRLGRADTTGVYAGSVNPSTNAASQSDQAHIGINGVGLMFECVAAELGWITHQEAQLRINLTLSALASELDGFALSRSATGGWIPTFFDRQTGARLGSGPAVYTTLDTGLNAAGVLFARNYFEVLLGVGRRIVRWLRARVRLMRNTLHHTPSHPHTLAPPPLHRPRRPLLGCRHSLPAPRSPAAPAGWRRKCSTPCR